jgi:glycosyltransferase involved in cell wall biosynthesis
MTVTSAQLSERFAPAGAGARRTALFFAEYFPPYMGSDRRIFDLARSLTDWSVEFAVVPPLRILGGRCEEALTEYFQRHFIDGIVEDESGGIHGHYFILPSGLMRAWKTLPLPVAYGFTLPYLVTKAAAYLRARRPDVVVVAHPSYLCGIVGLLAAHVARIPALLDYPDAWTPLAVETADISPVGTTARILHVLETLTARSAHRIVSITDRLTEYIRGLGARAPIDIVGNGADHRHFDVHATLSARTELGYRPDDEVVLYSGRLEPWSGVHDISQTIQNVCELRPSARFLFVGDGTAAQTLIEDVAKLGLERQVQFIGFQRYTRMPSLIAAADVAVVPFPRTPTTEACSPVKLFEYMLMKKAVITTDLAGVREVVDDRHVVFVNDLGAEQLTGAILSLLSDRKRRNALETAAYDLCVKRFTWEALAEKFSASMHSAAALPVERR